MRKFAAAVAALVSLATTAAAGAAPPPQGYQSDGAFAGSYALQSVQSTQATAQRTSCYTPETTYFDFLAPTAGYPDGGMSPCNGSSTTGENLGPYATQDKTVADPMRVKDHSESDIRVDPKNPNHLIGQSKWVVSAEGYNHLLGFYESFDGGLTWPVQGHVPGYEGWTDNTDPVGAFDPYGNFYSLVLPYQFYYSKSGGHVYNNGSNQINPTVPPEAVGMSVRKFGGGVNGWNTTQANGQPDYLMTAPNASTNDPDKQWVTIDDNPATSSHYRGRVYAMWTLFVKSPSTIFESHADTLPNGTHTPWSTPQILPTTSGKRWDTYLLPHVAPDGTVWTTTTSNPPSQGYSKASISLIWSKDGGATWQGPLPVLSLVNLPTYLNTTFREGIVNSFAVGTKRVGSSYPLYVTYEDGGSGLSNVFLIASYDNGQTWSAPIQVNDNAGPTEALQPNLNVAPSGTVSVAFYDRRLACPTGAEALSAGLAYDPMSPYGAANYCINAAIQFYRPNLAPVGHNVRLSGHTWDPQLSAPHPGSIGGSGTFIGDYFGVDSGGTWTYTTSVSTFNDGLNPNFHQQQDVAKIATP